MKLGAVNTVSFKSAASEQEDINFLLKIANTSDETLKAKAKLKAVDDFQNSKLRKAETKYATYYPVIDSVLTGAMAKGTLGDKAGSVLSNGLMWGVWIAATTTIQKVQRAIVNKIPPLKRFSEDHPVVSSFAGLTIPIMGGGAAIVGARKLLNRILENQQASEFIGKAKDFIDKPDSSKKVATWLNNNPKLILGASAVALGGLVIAAVTRISGIAKINSNTEKNLKEYEQLRYNATKTVANHLNEENKRLSA